METFVYLFIHSFIYLLFFSRQGFFVIALHVLQKWMKIILFNSTMQIMKMFSVMFIIKQEA